MSIETVTKRENHKSKTYKASCAKCGSDFKAGESDLSITFSRGEHCIQSINCPECGYYGLNFKQDSL